MTEMIQPRSIDRASVIALADHWADCLEGVVVRGDGFPMSSIVSAAMSILGRSDLYDQHPENAFYFGAEAVSRALFIVANDPFGDPREKIVAAIKDLCAEFAADAETHRSDEKLDAARKLVEGESLSGAP